MPYIKEAFDVTTFEQAKNVVLSSDPTDPSKFDSETQYLIKVIEQNVNINNNSTVLDFGCGMGRISNELIVRFNCKVVGVDISPSMLTFALLYTANMNKFTPLTDYSVEDSIDCALSIFVLQHCQDPQKEIDNIVKVLKPQGILVLLNEPKRWVPSSLDNENYVIWADDNFDIFQYLDTKLEKISVVPYINKDLQIIFYRKNSTSDSTRVSSKT